MNTKDLFNLIIYHNHVFDGRNGNVLKTIDLAKTCAIECNLSLSEFLNKSANVIIKRQCGLSSKRILGLSVIKLICLEQLRIINEEEKESMRKI